MATGKKVKAIQAPSFEETLTTESIGLFIKARRTQQGLNTKDAAMLCGVSAHTLNNIENGISGMKVSSVLSIMTALGIKLQVAPWSES
ncbi:MAG: helix-turn-helix domain-containing protein [Sulfurimonas sp.]|nr:helix-turn-helix domain-containing protein [Sulfurimonas sp.]MBL1245121.1 helix-turn-helix domain-containing protein [Sulfurimonas sp.]